MTSNGLGDACLFSPQHVAPVLPTADHQALSQLCLSLPRIHSAHLLNVPRGGLNITSCSCHPSCSLRPDQSLSLIPSSCYHCFVNGHTCLPPPLDCHFLGVPMSPAPGLPHGGTPGTLGANKADVRNSIRTLLP